MSNWLDLSDNANTLKSSYFSGFVDIKGGNLQTRDTTDHLMIAGDASFNQKVYIGGDISWNPNNLANDCIPSAALIGSSSLLSEVTTADVDAAGAVMNNTSNDVNLRNRLFVGGDITLVEPPISNNTLKGSQIDGLNTGDRLGAVSINNDGTIVATGSPKYDTTDVANVGIVSIYEWNGTDWAIKGSPIVGTNNNEQLGYSLAINDAGTIIVIGGYGYNVFDGITHIYEWSGSDWVLKGNKINAGSTNEYSGMKVSINNDGTIIAKLLIEMMKWQIMPV